LADNIPDKTDVRSYLFSKQQPGYSALAHLQGNPNISSVFFVFCVHPHFIAKESMPLLVYVLDMVQNNIQLNKL
jgi:hypothetical protein